MNKMLFTSFLFFTVACGSARPYARIEKNPDSLASSDLEKDSDASSQDSVKSNHTEEEPAHGGMNDQDSQSELEENLLLAPAYKDPDRAEVSIVQTRVVASTAWGVEVPILKVQKSSADYVEVLRCKSSHQITLPDGSPLQEALAYAQEEAASSELLRWAWTEASGNAHACRMVSRRFSGAAFQDLASPAGSHYYVLNPCVTETFLAPEKKFNCSFKLQISAPVRVIKSTKDLLREALSVHLQAQAEATGLLAKLQYTAERIAINRELCEKGQIVEERSANLWNGMVQLAAIGLTSVVGSSLSAIPLASGLPATNIAKLAVSLFGTVPKLPASCKNLETDFSKGKQFAADYELALEEVEQSATELRSRLEATKQQTELFFRGQ